MSDDDWVMGALAQQGYYQPTTDDPWKKLDDAQLERRIVPDPGMAFGTTTPQEDVYVAPKKAEAAIGALVPQSPAEWGLAAFGPAGRLAGKAGKIGALAAGAYGSMTDEAEAGPLSKISNAIKAFHSSPHTFDKFDISRIGTGEGAQVYGHGLYFAENPAVSGQGGQYWNDFRHRFGGNEGKAAELLQQHGFDRSKALKVLNEEIEQARALPTDKMFNEVAKQSHIEQLLARQRLLESGKPVGPRTYEVDINADPSHMLDWDKPLHQQPHVEDALFSKFMDQMSRKKATEELDLYQRKTGDQLYRVFSKDPREASAILSSEGVPGIKYLDQGSRIPDTKLHGLVNDAKAVLYMAEQTKDPALIAKHQANVARLEAKRDAEKSSNYVVFDPKIIDIRKMYGIGGIGAAYGMGDIASQDKYQQRL